VTQVKLYRTAALLQTKTENYVCDRDLNGLLRSREQSSMGFTNFIGTPLLMVMAMVGVTRTIRVKSHESKEIR
jgi:hypothetical protein